MENSWVFSTVNKFITTAFVFLILFNTQVFAQVDTSEYSHVYVISKTRVKSNIVVGNRDFGKISFREVVKIKVFSKGNFETAIHVPSIYPLIVSKPFESGQDVYFLVEPDAFKEISVELGQELIGDAKRVIELTESLKTPLLSEKNEKPIDDQEKHSAVVNDFSFINFVNLSTLKSAYEIYINGRLMSTIGFQENLRVKVFSEGRLSITTTNGNDVYKLFLDVKHDTEYFVSANFGRVIDDVQRIGRHMEDVVNTINIVEDPNRPFLLEADRSAAQGTCFLINSKGYLLTNHHVVEGAEKVSIKGINGDFTTWYEAMVVAVDVDMDMALLKLKDETLAFGPIPYRLVEKATGQGAKAFVLGYPYTAAMGEEIKVTDGIISAGSGYKGSLSQYQFSAPIQPGNSGSPLFNGSGEVIGIINSKLRGAENTGYAIKSPYVYTFVNQVEGVSLPESVALSSSSLEELVKRVKPFIFIIKAE